MLPKITLSAMPDVLTARTATTLIHTYLADHGDKRWGKSKMVTYTHNGGQIGIWKNLRGEFFAEFYPDDLLPENLGPRVGKAIREKKA